jgi:hypothetical protein
VKIREHTKKRIWQFLQGQFVHILLALVRKHLNYIIFTPILTEVEISIFQYGSIRQGRGEQNATIKEFAG